MVRTLTLTKYNLVLGYDKQQGGVGELASRCVLQNGESTEEKGLYISKRYAKNQIEWRIKTYLKK